jgi:hypothetical protein
MSGPMALPMPALSRPTSKKGPIWRSASTKLVGGAETVLCLGATKIPSRQQSRLNTPSLEATSQ